MVETRRTSVLICGIGVSSLVVTMVDCCDDRRTSTLHCVGTLGAAVWLNNGAIYCRPTLSTEYTRDGHELVLKPRAAACGGIGRALEACHRCAFAATGSGCGCI